MCQFSKSAFKSVEGNNSEKITSSNSQDSQHLRIRRKKLKLKRRK